MKNIILILLAICGLNQNTFAQKIAAKKVPASVLNTFKNTYPLVKKAKWEKDKDNNFEASFKLNKTSFSAKYSGMGNLIETEKSINISSLPDIVVSTISDRFPGYKIDEAEQVELPDGTIFYEVELEKGKEEIELQINVNGEILKQEKENKED